MAYRSCICSAILHGSETWRSAQNKAGILQGSERCMESVLCDVKLVDRKKTKHRIHQLGLEETMDQLAKANGVCWYDKH